MSLAAAGVLIGATIAVMVAAIITLHDHDHALDHRLCAAEQTDRVIDQQIVDAARLPVAVPQITRQECP